MRGAFPCRLWRSSRAERQLARFAARQSGPLQSEYCFLVGRFIDQATLARASAIARHWGVHPHEVMIANGWLEAEDYYRALAERCAAPFKDRLVAADVAPAATASPRQSLARGVLKERARAGSFVFAPDRLRPNALSEMLARLSPYAFSLASPHAVRGAICHHFGPSLALHAIEGLASRHPGMSARTRPARWQRLAVVTAALAVIAAMALAPVETIWAITLALAWLFVPLIALRLVAAYRLFACGEGRRRLPPRRACRITSCRSTRCWCRSTAKPICCRGLDQGAHAPRLPGGEARHQARVGGG